MKKTAFTTSKNTFITIHKDLFLSIDEILSSSISTTIIVPHVCNNIDIFGSGFTAGIMNYYPLVKDNYHLLAQIGGCVSLF